MLEAIIEAKDKKNESSIARDVDQGRDKKVGKKPSWRMESETDSDYRKYMQRYHQQIGLTFLKVRIKTVEACWITSTQKTHKRTKLKKDGEQEKKEESDRKQPESNRRGNDSIKKPPLSR